MSSEDDQKRHINQVISAIRDDDAEVQKPRRPGDDVTNPVGSRTEEDDEEYYVDEDERRQWDYDESNPATLETEVDRENPGRRQPGRNGKLGLLLDWRLVAALAILVAGLYMVNLSGNGDAPAAVATTQSEDQAERLAQLEARLVELEQRLAAANAGSREGEAVLVGASADSANAASREELQILRDQVNAGLKAQEEATRSAVQSLERRLAATIDSKVAAVSRPAPAATSGTGQGQAAPSSSSPEGPWFVNVATYSRRATADAMVKRLEETGRTAAIVPATIGGEPSFRVRVINLESRDAAQTAARRLESEFGLRGLWVGES